MKRILTALCTLLALQSNVLVAQQDLIVNQQTIIPQSNYLNPGRFKPMGGYFGLPMVSSVYLNFNNTGFRIVDVATRPSGFMDSTVIDFNNVLPNLKRNESLNLNMAIDLFNLGFKIKKNYFMFSAREFINMRLGYSQEFMTLLWKGNAAFLGKEADLSGFNFEAMHYREYAIGYSREFGENLSVGFRGKYLYGMENIHTAQNNSKVFTDATNFNLRTSTDLVLQTSGISNFDTITTDIPEYLFGRNNTGWAIDLGGEYKFNNGLALSASVLDIGRINWGELSVNKTFVSNGSFDFQGININKLVNITSDTAGIIDQTLDSLSESLGFEERVEAYSTPINTRIYANATYDILKRTRVGATFYSEVRKNRFNPAFSLGITQGVGNVLSFALNWSYLNRSPANIGFGFVLNAGPFQFYATADNVLAALQPQSAKNVHAHLGFNIIVDYRTKKEATAGKDKLEDGLKETKGKRKGKADIDTDQDGIIDREDKCPTVAGFLKFKGCPDTDNDGVQDSLDRCPSEPGDTLNAGCPWPDSDGDGLKDNVDSCKTVAGVPELKGCPWLDTDNDGVTDNNDSCKTQPGPAANKGCPWGDTDNDGITDDKDRCPAQPGPIDNSGCPYGDRDGDGLSDNLDNCPDVAGPSENKGCPYGDSDGDGVNDDKDKCPKTPGTPENDGCPKIEQKEQEVLDLAFKNLEFSTGTAVIRPESFNSLMKLSDLLKTKPDFRLLISGHTDNVGQPAKNMELSRKRAEAVKTFLVGQGVAGMRLTTEWFGQEKPIADNATSEGRDRNRRVEMKVIFD